MTIKFWRMGGMEWEKIETKFVFGVKNVIFAVQHQYSEYYYKIKLFGGDGSFTTLTDVAICIKSPLHFLTFSNCNK